MGFQWVLRTILTFYPAPNIFIGKKSGGEFDISLLDLLMYLKTNDSVLKANTAGYIMHLTYNDDEAKRKIR